jgi:hypothetical protein
LVTFIASHCLAEKRWDDQIIAEMALTEGSAPISFSGAVVVYTAPPSERRRRWKFGKL